VTLRFASLADQGALARLAELDSTAPPTHPVLLAEVDGRLRAALAVTGGAVIADPFTRRGTCATSCAHELANSRRHSDQEFPAAALVVSPALLAWH
jgi:hypothetical protein